MARLTVRTFAGVANLDYPANAFYQDGTKDTIATSAFRQRAIERLAAYEDTGLEPEEVQHWKACFSPPTMQHLIEMCEKIEAERDTYRALGTVEELSELVKAQDEGRVHIAPIRDGTSIFYHIDDDENMFPVLEDGIFEGTYVNGYTECICGEMGVDWFLTRAEALEAIGGGGDG